MINRYCKWKFIFCIGFVYILKEQDCNITSYNFLLITKIICNIDLEQPLSECKPLLIKLIQLLS